MTADPLKALFYPLETGAAADTGGKVLFVNGRQCEGLSRWPRGAVAMQQYFKPWADAAARGGFKNYPEIPGGIFDIVLVLAPQQQDEAMQMLAAGLQSLRDGGLLVCAAANDAGGRRLKKNAQALGLKCAEESKYKSRVIWGTKGGVDEKSLAGAIETGGYRRICGGRFISRPGVFSWSGIDPGSALLAGNIPAESLSGRGADFGCGFGFLSINALKDNPGITEIFCIDADARAVESCRRNLADFRQARFVWEDIARGNRNLPQDLDWIIMNPPFHEGKRALPEAGIAFIGTARECLRRGGKLWMVANAHLPYEKTLAEKFTSVKKICEQHGYKIFCAS